ncbi:leucine--tRNA ligase [Patescibacteria group bacterium]|nr:leucine--tRNA ligase [Patescibacteria group bacterium]MBU4078011.1 leucine--tRNA ligase [Patescibacteria group bacterium]
MTDYNFSEIEKNWQKKWAENKIFEADNKSKKPKFFILDMFPYPSGDGLHVGHPRGYVGSDVISNYKRMKGFNVLHPMGWDAFGLPAENYAIKTGIHPSITTKKNIQRFKEQMQNIGLSYDWTREINTTDPDYYKWTQWIFLKLFEKGLAYRRKLPINWCPSCKTGLANEEVIAGKCERCGAETTKKDIEQWVLKITDYAEELLQGLDGLDWPEKIKEMQRNWIGKSEGADIEFKIQNSKFKIQVFTTRPDTIFGATFMVLAPEHNLVDKITTPDKKKEVEKYIEESRKKLDIERQAQDREKTGVFTGAYALNPATKENIPIYSADYVLPSYGYGAIMAVPAHDERDHEFAEKFKLEIKEIELDKTVEQAIKLYGKKTINYKLRDWIFSRQRYWGEPIPLVFCEDCKKEIEKGNTKNFSKGELLNPGWIALPDKELPLELPKLEKYQPSGTGDSPLSNAKTWLKATCPRCKGEAEREINTMPQWAGSCWYFIRYLDPKNKKEIADKKLIKDWLPVNFYIGGAEHAVLHLLYSRFWIKVLKDEKILLFDEPFKKLRTIGLILASDGQKMSKSRGNVINPDEIIRKYGADAFRLYEMFMGPFDQPIAWDSNGIIGIKRFLDKVWKLKVINSDNLIVDKVVKKVTEDIEAEKFNTGIAFMMEFVNLASIGITKSNLETFLKILSPFAPHIAEEMWQGLEHKTSIFKEKWPKYKDIKDKEIELVIQINGKVRDTISAKAGISEKEAKELALKSGRIQNWLKDKKIKKTIFIKNKLINFVIK